MVPTPAWWRPDAAHWKGRTAVVIALLALLATTAVGVAGLNRAPSTPPLISRPSSPGASDSGELCSANSEMRVSDGWGPDRPTYHDDTFPSALTFNSTSDNPNLGDERNFVSVKPKDLTQAGGWVDSLEVQNNREYLVNIYVRLDGPTNHAAKGTKLSVNLPACTGHRIGIAAFVSSLDAFPNEIWDGASFWSRNDFNLALVPDSGYVYSNAHPGGLALPVGELVTAKGISLGSTQLDGVFQPGYEHSVRVAFTVRAQVAQ